MPKTLTASDRTALLNLAASLPQGSEERRAILAGLKKAPVDKTAASGQFVGEGSGGKAEYKDGFRTWKLSGYLGYPVTNLWFNINNWADRHAPDEFEWYIGGGNSGKGVESGPNAFEKAQRQGIAASKKLLQKRLTVAQKKLDEAQAIVDVLSRGMDQLNSVKIIKNNPTAPDWVAR